MFWTLGGEANSHRRGRGSTHKEATADWCSIFGSHIQVMVYRTKYEVLDIQIGKANVVMCEFQHSLTTKREISLKSFNF